MVLIDMINIVLIKQAELKKFGVVRTHCEVFKLPEIVAAVDHHNQVFDTDTELAILVVSRLYAFSLMHTIAHNHSGYQWFRAILRYAAWSFMYVEEVSNSMPSTMAVIKSSLPEPTSSQDVDVATIDIGLGWIA